MRTTFFDTQVTTQPTATPTFKVVVLGNSGVGKTSLINRFCRQTFSNSYQPTIGYPWLSNNTAVGQRQVNLKLWEVNPEKDSQYGHAQRFAIAGASAYIVVFELTSMLSFEAAIAHIDMLQDKLNVSKEPGTIFLVGSKLDLANNREVCDELAQSFADQAGCLYMPVSSKQSINVDNLFMLIAEKQLAKKSADQENDWFMIADEGQHARELAALLSDAMWIKTEGVFSKLKAGLKEIMTVLDANAEKSEDEYFAAIQKLARTFSNKDKNSIPFFSSANNNNTETPLKTALQAICNASSLADATKAIAAIQTQCNQPTTLATIPTNSAMK